MSATERPYQFHGPVDLDTAQDFIDAGCPPEMARYVQNPFDPEALFRAMAACRQDDIVRNKMWFALIARYRARDLRLGPWETLVGWLSDQLRLSAGEVNNYLKIGRNPFVREAYVKVPITLSLALNVVQQETGLGVHRSDPPDYRKMVSVLAAGIEALWDGLPIQEQKRKVREAAAMRKSW